MRLWPAIIVTMLQLTAIFGLPIVTDRENVILSGKLFGPPLGTLLLLAWWLLFSRINWDHRLMGVFSFIFITVAGYMARHPTMQFSFVLYVVPTATTVAIVALGLLRKKSWTIQSRFALCVAASVFLASTFLRFDGAVGSRIPQFSLRWSETAEQQFLARQTAGGNTDAKIDDIELASSSAVLGDWPGFRGPDRDSRIQGLTIDTDWPSGSPPEIWRRRVGPGWSSISVVGPLLFTQEQRGKSETVVCYRADTGIQVWEHTDQARFHETYSGAGPRATPTFADGRVYTVGAEGAVNCLEAATGETVWTRNLVQDTSATVPFWGFSSSPLLIDNVAVVFSGAGSGRSIVAYDTDDGRIRWTAGDGTKSYSSAHRATFHGRRQVLFCTEMGLESFDPGTGTQLWRHEWHFPDLNRCVQPSLVGDDSIVFATGTEAGTRRLNVRRSGGVWSADFDWETNDLKPHFNDFVVHQGNAYGFDGNFSCIFCCVDLDTGKRRWKRGRYGNGQVLLIADQDLLLVLSEKGNVFLLETNPDKLVEKARFRAITGKTWNHPAIAHGRLFVRNGAEMACFHLADAVADTGDAGAEER